MAEKSKEISEMAMKLNVYEVFEKYIKDVS